MRALKALIAFLFVLAGIAFGALNQQPILIDLYIARFHVQLGLAFIVCLMIGVVLGGALLSISFLFKPKPLVMTEKMPDLPQRSDSP